MTQQVTGRIGYEGAGHGPYRPGTGTPGWDVVPAPRPAPVTPHPAPAPAWAAAPYVPVASGAPAPPASPGAPRPVVVVAVTVVALAVLTLVGVLLYPRIVAPVATTATTAAPTTVVVPAPASSGASSGSSSGSSSGVYSCGSANGYAIEVLNGNVPCTSARWVTTTWTTDGTTPMSGTGPAGTPYSWTCSGVTTSGDEVASCVSKKGSTFTISR